MRIEAPASLLRLWVARLAPAGFVTLSLSPAFGDFIRPRKADDPLIYGVKGGIVVAVHPYALDKRTHGGPRGLLRVGYEEDGRTFLINYIAVEPLIGRSRGLSELEKGGDGRPGKRFRVANTADAAPTDDSPAVAGRIRKTRKGRVLTFYVHVERFRNGAKPIVEVSLYESYPDRVRFRTLSAPGGKPMDQCVLTATMGNQARCRILWLESGPIFAPRLYAGYRGNGFVERRVYRANELRKCESGAAVAVISPDEFEPREVFPFPSGAWRHPGKWMAQFWLKEKGTYDETLHCRVNGRRVYWRSRTPLPGGIAFENFELRESFQQGREVWFGATTENPRDLFGFACDATPGSRPPRTIPAAEAERIAQAAKEGRRLTNGDFRKDLTGWQTEGGAEHFRTFRQDDQMALTTFGAHKDADKGRIYQCFQIPDGARELRFFLHGGCDPERLAVALWSGDRLWRRMTARDDNTPFEVRWNVEPLRGKTVTLEIRDDSTRPWGFIGAHGFALENEEDRPPP